MKTIITYDGLLEVLVDDEDYARLVTYNWHAIKGKYIYRREGPSSIYMAQDVIGLPPKGLEIDHEDRNTLNNTRKNLRFVTSAQNQQNRKRSSTGFLGVIARSGSHTGKKKFEVRIMKDGVGYWVGSFMTAEQGARAYDAYATKLYGDKATLNFPRGGENLPAPQPPQNVMPMPGAPQPQGGPVSAPASVV